MKKRKKENVPMVGRKPFDLAMPLPPVRETICAANPVIGMIV